MNIRTKPTSHGNNLSLSATPWNIKPDTEYILKRREQNHMYVLRDANDKHVSFLLERDLIVLFEEEDLFMANLCGIEGR